MPKHPPELEPGRDGTWLVIYHPNFTRILDGTGIPGTALEADTKSGS
jgi:hypothetical protein